MSKDTGSVDLDACAEGRAVLHEVAEMRRQLTRLRALVDEARPWVEENRNWCIATGRSNWDDDIKERVAAYNDWLSRATKERT